MTNEQQVDPQALLPWYVNGTLSDEERAVVEAWLSESEDAKQELASLQALQKAVQADQDTYTASEFGWRRLQKEIAKNNQTSVKSAGVVERLWKPAFATAAAVIIGLQVAIISGPSDDAGFEVLSGGPVLTKVDTNTQLVLQLQFKQQAEWTEVNGLLNDIQARLVGLPSALGVVEVVVPKQLVKEQHASQQAFVDWLGTQPAVKYAQVTPRD